MIKCPPQSQSPPRLPPGCRTGTDVPCAADGARNRHQRRRQNAKMTVGILRAGIRGLAYPDLERLPATATIHASTLSP